ncbi:uncharacterized protein PG998_001933 [Apiospora kogelbergensis]|uniref:uncharacterized protein n=1 Tax=Apiospora kogelbergensis TaxID=1337665 RepID=UPI0031301DAA
MVSSRTVRGAATLALLSIASAAAVPTRGLEVLREEPYTNNSTIVWYAPSGDTSTQQQQQQQHSRSRRVQTAGAACGDNLVTCTSRALARADTCSGLFEYLSAKQTTTPPRDSVAVCWVNPDSPDNNQCCTAWREYNSGIRLGYLLGAATKTWGQCKTGNGLVGGVTNEVNLNGICQSQCLGNSRECF